MIIHKQVHSVHPSHNSIYFNRILWCFSDILSEVVLLTQDSQTDVCSCSVKSINCFVLIKYFLFLPAESLSTWSRTKFQPTFFFLRMWTMKKNLANRTCFPLSVGGHKFSLIIWPFSQEFIMLAVATCFGLKDWTKKEKQALKLIRLSVFCFLAVYFPKTQHLKDEKLIIPIGVI